MHDQLAVGRNQDIELDGVDAELTAAFESRQGVFRQKSGGPAVADHERFFRNFGNHCRARCLGHAGHGKRQEYVGGHNDGRRQI